MNEQKRPSRRAVHLTALALLALWIASWAISYVHLGAWSLPVALVIAALKAVLVVLVFMELASEQFSMQAAVLSAGALVTVFIVLTVLDAGAQARPDLGLP